MEETQRRHCEAPIRFVAGRSNLAGLGREGPRGLTGVPRRRQRRALCGHAPAKAPGRSLTSVGRRSSSMNGAELPLRCCVRGGLRPTAFGNGALASAREVRAPRADAECRRAPLHLWVQVASRNRLKRAGPGGISHLRHPGESRSPGRIEKCLKWTVFERVSQQAQAVLRWAEAISRAW